MPHHLNESEWVDRFLTRLGSVQPGIHAAGATERALEAYANGGDLGPEEAAEMYALEQPQGEPGEPGEV
jgi:hypothetical protein